MTRNCPDGHASAALDYCDICGLPMGAAGEPAPPAAAAPPHPGGEGADVQACPHCGARSPAANLFCENCGFDFTTGALPERIPLADGTFVADPVRLPPPPAVPAPQGPPPAVQVPATPPHAAQVPAAQAPPVSVPAPGAPAARADRPEHQPPSRRERPDWVAEIWVDPGWFALQEGEGDCPSPGPPEIVLLGSAGALIGRSSAARGIHPEIDCGTDTAVSRRHARLDTDGRRWWVEDLGSSNGTFVGGAAEAPPEQPAESGRRLEIDADDRIYIGAWTRIVVRPATDSDRRDYR